LDERVSERIHTALAEEERNSAEMAFRVRTIALSGLAVLFFFLDPAYVQLYYVGIIALLILYGFLHARLRHRAAYRPWHSYIFVTLNVLTVAYAVLMPNPLTDKAFPVQMALRAETFPFFYLFLAFSALSYSPGRVVWTGIVTAVAWGTAVSLIAARTDSITYFGFRSNSDLDLASYLDSHFIDLLQQTIQILLFMIVAATMATGVWRTRRLVRKQVEAARERANLARYFSPDLATELANMDEPFGEVRSQDVAVLFADIVGFTALAESIAPEKVITLLREFHGLMADIVFRHDGTLDKYIGDCVMATFGTPWPRDDDAARALACAQDMVRAVAEWSAGRTEHGEASIRIGVGVHYGPVVLGDIGDERRLEFAVIGDTVNVAARLEALTRRMAASVVVSQDLVSAALGQGAVAASALGQFRQAPEPQQIRGRGEPVKVWTLARAA
jgi:adenylate cyclase